MAKKKRRQPFQFTIDNQVWFYRVTVRVGGNKESATRYFEKHWKVKVLREDQSVSASMFWAPGVAHNFIWFEDVPDAGDIAHEALHSVLHALAVKGLGRPCNENEEAYAYCLDWTVREISKRVT